MLLDFERTSDCTSELYCLSIGDMTTNDEGDLMIELMEILLSLQYLNIETVWTEEPPIANGVMALSSWPALF